MSNPKPSLPSPISAAPSSNPPRRPGGMRPRFRQPFRRELDPPVNSSTDPKQPMPSLSESAPSPPAADAPCPAKLSNRPQYPPFANSFRINTSKGVAKQRVLSSLESAFTEKWGP